MNRQTPAHISGGTTFMKDDLAIKVKPLFDPSSLFLEIYPKENN